MPGSAWPAHRPRVRRRNAGSCQIGAAFVFTVALCVLPCGSAPLIQRLGAARFTALAMLASTAATQLHFFATQPLTALVQPWPVYFYGAAMVFSTVLPVFMQSAAIRRIGSARAVLVGVPSARC